MKYARGNCVLTVLRKIAFLSIASSSWIIIYPHHLSFADELDNLQRARESAQMQYVNELGTGKYKTAAQRDALKKQYLEPNEQKTKEYFQSISVMPSARPVKPEEIDLNTGPKTNLSTTQGASLGDNQAIGHASSQTTRSSAGVPPQEKSPLRPEYVLDGSNVPKEITFGAPSFDNPKDAAPSPSPTAKKK
jgi:hypothetical protein